ncbi:MAG: signal recognition particle protein [Firmicutes bacterium]|nr:signal recognition particle protein [Bacillota bacterium]
MGLFSGLSEKLGHIFKKITSRGKLTELEIKQTMREIRVALLEADVNFTVVKDFIARVSEKAVGQEILESLTPGQQVIKIVNEELTALMGSTAVKLEVSSKLPTVFMMCGLQGAGKTTMCGKLARMLLKQGKKPMLAACDIYRPAAINQLKVVGKAVNAEVFEKGTQNPVKTASEAVEYARSRGYDTVIIDTAGRLHINDELMKELENVRAAVAPTEILLTVDAMTGQDAVTVAAEFDKRLAITGVILTKLDGDTRGGAALSIRAVTGKPIKLCGTGEKPDDLEQFHPDRMASRILGMGDVLTLIERATSAVSEEQLEKMEKRLREAKFTLDDFLVQFESLGKMGDISEIMAMMPGMQGKNLGNMQVDEQKIERFKAIIRSMTKQEREHPDIIKASRRKRIAAGSGSTIQEVNQLLKQYEQTKDMMKSMKGGKMPNFGGGKQPKPKFRYR